MTEQLSIGIYLLILAVIDMFSKKIDFRLIACGIVPLILSLAVSAETGIIERLEGLAAGGAVLVISYLTREKVGKGDALILCFTGAILGLHDEIMLIGTSLLLSAVYSVAMLILGRMKKTDRLAFVPFIFAGYLMLLFLKGQG